MCAPDGLACDLGCTVDAGTEPTRCGRTQCQQGQVCCDASCGVCGESKDWCALVDYVCLPECSAMDASGDGLCDAFFGYAWDGSSCTGISGCSCTGTDCDFLFESPEACTEVHAACPNDG